MGRSTGIHTPMARTGRQYADTWFLGKTSHDLTWMGWNRKKYPAMGNNSSMGRTSKVYKTMGAAIYAGMTCLLTMGA